MQSLKKSWHVVSNMTWGIWWISTQSLKSLKISLWGTIFSIFVQTLWGLSQKNTEELSFMTLNNDAKFEYYPDLVVSKMAWGIGWTFIRAPKSLKNCTLMGSFCPKHIMFQLENFRGVMCHMTLKGVAKFKEKLTCGLKNDIRNLVNFYGSSRKSEKLHFDRIFMSKA